MENAVKVTTEIVAGSTASETAWVFAGAGIAGIMYAGVVRAAEHEGVHVPKFLAGTSAGALVASFLAKGLKSREIAQLLETDFRLFNRDAFGFVIEKIADLKRFLDFYGFNSGKRLYEWLHDILGDATFESVYRETGRTLAVFAVDADTWEVVRFDREHTPDVQLADAARASASYPVHFTPWPWSARSMVSVSVATLAHLGGRTRLLIDGGVAANFPMMAFPKADTVGFCPAEDQKPRPLATRGDVLAFLSRFVEGLVRRSNEAGLFESMMHRRALRRESDVVTIPRHGLGALDFDAPAELLTLVELSGFEVARAYFQSHGRQANDRLERRILPGEEP